MWQRETEAEKKKRRRKQGGRGRRRLRVCGGGRRSETLAVKLVEKFPFPALLFPFPRYYQWQGIKNALKCFPPPSPRAVSVEGRRRRRTLPIEETLSGGGKLPKEEEEKDLAFGGSSSLIEEFHRRRRSARSGLAPTARGRLPSEPVPLPSFPISRRPP